MSLQSIAAAASCAARPTNIHERCEALGAPERSSSSMQKNRPIWYGASKRRPRVAFSDRKPATSARASRANDRGTDRHSRGPRTEEKTEELQHPMRIEYA